MSWKRSHTRGDPRGVFGPFSTLMKRRSSLDNSSGGAQVSRPIFSQPSLLCVLNGRLTPRIDSHLDRAKNDKMMIYQNLGSVPYLYTKPLDQKLVLHIFPLTLIAGHTGRRWDRKRSFLVTCCSVWINTFSNLTWCLDERPWLWGSLQIRQLLWPYCTWLMLKAVPFGARQGKTVFVLWFFRICVMEEFHWDCTLCVCVSAIHSFM